MPKDQKNDKVEIDFNKLIDNYKRDNYKSMEMINHEFLYSHLHPLEDDMVLALEKNVYPTSL